MSVRIKCFLPRQIKKQILTSHFKNHIKMYSLHHNLNVYLTPFNQNYYRHCFNPEKRSLILDLRPNQETVYQMIPNIVDAVGDKLIKIEPEDIHTNIDLSILDIMYSGELIQTCQLLAMTGNLRTLEISGYTREDEAALIRTLIIRSMW